MCLCVVGSTLTILYRRPTRFMPVAMLAFGYGSLNLEPEKMMKYAAVIPVLISLAACTTTDEIIIDKKGVDMSRYEEDLADCRGYGTEVKTGEKGARGAASGA